MQWREDMAPMLTSNIPNQVSKPWKAKKEDVVKHWEELPPGLPMGQLRVIPKDHVGPTLSFDGLRIAGSPQFINYVLSRLKDVLAYESESSRLQLIYKQQVDNKTQQPVPQSYVLYLQVKSKESGPELEKPKIQKI